MWYYDPKYKQCNSFKYGGCLGNANRFQEREWCERTCIQTASLSVRLKHEEDIKRRLQWFCGIGQWAGWKMAWIITALAHSYVKCSWILIKLTVNKSCTALGNFGDIHPFTKVIPQNVTFMPSDFSVSSGLRATPWSRAMSRQWTKVLHTFTFYSDSSAKVVLWWPVGHLQKLYLRSVA